jgi:hypothetical protein
MAWKLLRLIEWLDLYVVDECDEVKLEVPWPHPVT